MSLLEGRSLRYVHGGRAVLDDLSITVAGGEVLAVRGASGSGKSTLLHCLCGLLRPAAGEVWLDGQRIDAMPERARCALRLRRFGFVFQFGDLVPELTMLENVELPLRLAGVPRRRAREAAALALRDLAIADVGGRRVHQISGGELQRAAVARALVHRPQVVFADEPTGALDVEAGKLVMEALIHASRSAGAAVVVVTHADAVAAMADRAVTIIDGHLAAAVPAAV